MRIRDRLEPVGTFIVSYSLLVGAKRLGEYTLIFKFDQPVFPVGTVAEPFKKANSVTRTVRVVNEIGLGSRATFWVHLFLGVLAFVATLVGLPFIKQHLEDKAEVKGA